MCSEWKEEYLNDICKRIHSGGTPKTTNSEYWNGDINWLSSGETRSQFINSTEKKITQKGVENSSTRLVNKGMTVIASAGQGNTRGQVSLCLVETYINQSVIALKADNTKVLDLFLFYNMKNRYKELRQLSDGHSIRGSLTTKTIKKMKIKYPTIIVQKGMCDILFTLDKRIENNSKINNALEELAQTLFKRWFIDFEFPNEEGKPYKSSGGKMINSEVGMIPEGWIITTFGEIVRFIKGKKPSKIEKKRFKNSARYLTIDNMKNNIELYCETEKMTVVKPLDIMMIMDGASSGTIHYGDEGVISSTASKLEMDKNYNNFIYCFLKFHEQLIKDNTTGSAIPHTDKGFVNNFAVSLPMNGFEDPLFTSFDTMITSYREKVISNNIENNLLKELRDSLLPKLMSGEIKVFNVKGE